MLSKKSSRGRVALNRQRPASGAAAAASISFTSWRLKRPSGRWPLPRGSPERPKPWTAHRGPSRRLSHGATVGSPRGPRSATPPIAPSGLWAPAGRLRVPDRRATRTLSDAPEPIVGRATEHCNPVGVSNAIEDVRLQPTRSPTVVQNAAATTRRPPTPRSRIVAGQPTFPTKTDISRSRGQCPSCTTTSDGQCGSALR